MNIQSVNLGKMGLQNFKGKIIDSHGHVGKWTNDSFSTSGLLNFFNRRYNDGKDTVDSVVLSNLDCVYAPEGKPYRDEIEGNLSLIKECLHNDKLIPLVVCQPGFGCPTNIELLLNAYPHKIKGLKFHPACLNLAANDEKYVPYMELAEKYRKPCLFHSEVVIDEAGNFVRSGVSDPEKIYEMARRFPKVPVILGHMGLGGDEAHEAGIKTLIDSIENDDANLYADLAWVDWDNPKKPHIVDVVGKLMNTSRGDKTERLLFGTDAPLGVFGEAALKQDGAYDYNIRCIKEALKGEYGDDARKLISRIFYRNSKKLFDASLNKIV